MGHVNRDKLQMFTQFLLLQLPLYLHTYKIYIDVHGLYMFTLHAHEFRQIHEENYVSPPTL